MPTFSTKPFAGMPRLILGKSKNLPSGDAANMAPTTSDDEVWEWAASIIGMNRLCKVETVLKSYDVDPSLTEEEVLLAVPAIDLGHTNAYTPLVAVSALATGAAALVVTVVPKLVAHSQLFGMLGALGLLVLVAILIAVAGLTFSNVIINAGIRAGVQSIIEDRHKRGTLRRRPCTVE